MRHVKATYQPQWRITYVPRIACMLREPYRGGNRLSNFKGVKSEGDLSNQHAGQISANAKSKIRNAVLWLEAQAQWKWCYSKKSSKWFRWKLNFIHLTIPAQGIKSDQFIKKILNRFFLYAYRKTGMRTYVWKAEPQQRGEIHFHITSDCYIWKKTLQNIWNGCLRYYGVIGTHSNPPSTRVHPTHNIVNMTAYLIKYITKNDKDRRIIQGRLWGCSRNLSQAKNIFVTINENEVGEEGRELTKESYRVDEYDWLTMYSLKPNYFDNLPECEVLHKYRQKIRSIQKGYAPTKNFFYDEDGNPITFENAKKIGLKPIDDLLYQQQLCLQT